jgi:predicted Zn-dependent peptidase
MPSVRSVSLGVWLDAGSRHEAAPDSGITHFVEHMVFKGTERFSAREIACEIDGLGGHLDAFTSKETTAFTAKVLDERWPEALDILADMVQHPAFTEDDIEREKGVVLEELKMDEDNPNYLLGTIFASSFWKGHGMGRPIIGNQNSIRAFRRTRLRRFFKDTFRAPRLILAAAGNLNHGHLVREARQRFGGLDGSAPAPAAAEPIVSADIVLRDKASLEQVHLALGVGTFSARDPRRFAGFVLSTLLGGGVSSRLFQKIREEAGLAYSVYSDLSLYSDTGCLSIGAGTALDALPRVLEYTLHEFKDLKDRLAPAPEIRRAKDHLKGSLMLGLESTGSRMANLARQEAIHGRVRSLDEVNEAVEAVTARDVRDLANRWFQQDRIALSVLGDLRGLRVGREALAC